MELKISIEPGKPWLPGERSPLHISLDGKNCGDVTGETRAPFSEDELPAILCALEISSAVTHQFTLPEAQWLQSHGILKTLPESENGLVTLDNRQLDEKELLPFICERLREALFGQPGQYGLREALIAELTAFRRRQSANASAFHLNLKIRSKAPELFGYPWELLLLDKDSLWNAGDGKISLSRYIRYPGPRRPLREKYPVNILIVHSEPQQEEPLNLRDAEQIRAALKRDGARYGGHIRVTDVLRNPTLDELQQYLAGRKNNPEDFPHILHFAGHGEFGCCCKEGHFSGNRSVCECRECGAPLPDLKNCEGFAAFQGKDGKTQWVGAELLDQVLTPYSLQLAVLNACKTGIGRRGENVFNGLAQRLMRRAPAVIASPFLLDSQGAEKFAYEFYFALARGDSLTDALFHARHAMVAIPAFRHEWYRYVLYLRGEVEDGGQLLVPPRVSPPRVKEEAARETRTPATLLGSITDKLSYEVDFDEQEECFFPCVRKHRHKKNKLRGRPLICLMPGWANDTTAGELVERIRMELQDRRLASLDSDYAARKSSITSYSLPCDKLESPEALQLQLIKNIREQLYPEDLPESAGNDKNSIGSVFAKLQKLSPATNPLIFHTHLESDKLNTPLAPDLFQGFYDFWAHWNDQRHLLLVCVSIAYLKQPCTAWERLLGGFMRERSNRSFSKRLPLLARPNNRKVRACMLPPLRPVCRDEVSVWVGRMKERGISAPAIRHIQSSMKELFDSGKPPLVKGCLPMDKLCPLLDYLLLQYEPEN
ncbi:MAG: CHAT domain-containing protein [Gammaproteobacteria bacterium]|nr:CHAT domain-containing protein [Gammaproteobacteria bacterium]